MKESYPRTRVWPYVVLGLCCFGVVLAPPVSVMPALSDLVARCTAWRESDSPRIEDASSDGVVIAFDPGRSDLRGLHGRLQPHGAPFEPATDQGSSGLNPPDRGIERLSTTTAVGSVGSLRQPIRIVWQPPPGWVPQPIRPLRDDQVFRTSRVAIREPVANRISRSSDPGQIAEKLGTEPLAETFGPSQSLSTSNDSPSTELDDRQTKEPPPESAPGRIARTLPADTGLWPRCDSIHVLLDDAVRDRDLADWAMELRTTLALVEGKLLTNSATERDAIQRLNGLVRAPIDTSDWSYPQRQLFARIRHAGLRRVDVWAPLLDLVDSREATSSRQQSRDSVVEAARQLARWLDSNSSTSGWTQYLHLNQLQQLAHPGKVDARRLGEQTLARMYSKELRPEQNRFLQSHTFRALDDAVRGLVAASIEPVELVRSLERYESRPSRGHAERVMDILSRWDDGNRGHASVINAVALHYRNANFRVAITEQLINQLIPAFRQSADRVNDNILGAQIRGSSSTMTNLSVHLLPDPSRIRVGLLANGRVRSSTTSRKGPVTMFNRGDSTFAAGKELTISPKGMFISGTETRASAGNRVVGLRTNMDSIPIVGWIVRNLARQQHDEQRPFLHSEISKRVRRNAKQQIDHQVQSKLANVEEQFTGRVVNPLRSMELDPRAMELRTTEDRIMMRARLASPVQFGAHTPRPQALADSWMSFQVHETAANNLIEQLQLRGRRMTLADLTDEVSQKLGLSADFEAGDYRDVVVAFDAKTPLECEFHDNQIAITLHLAELDNGGRAWNNFSVAACYRIDKVRQLDVELVRDGGIELASQSLTLRDQIALRGIFTKLFAKKTRLEVVQKALQRQPVLHELAVTQFILRDGWLAVSLGKTEPHLVELPTTLR